MNYRKLGKTGLMVSEIGLGGEWLERHNSDEVKAVIDCCEDAVHSGRVIDVITENGGFTFSIDSYGACEGPYVIASGQIGKTVFFSKKEAEDRLGI